MVLTRLGRRRDGSGERAGDQCVPSAVREPPISADKASHLRNPYRPSTSGLAAGPALWTKTGLECTMSPRHRTPTSTDGDFPMKREDESATASMPNDGRRPYRTPELRKLGRVSDLTMALGVSPGTDNFSPGQTKKAHP